jgi:peptidoglycan/LPS O-acetylase OafA/YrhL
VHEFLSKRLSSHVVTNQYSYNEDTGGLLVKDNSRNLPELTAARALLAFWVLAYHLDLHLGFPLLRPWVKRGYLGVDGFFILSGCVLAHRYPALTLRPTDLLIFWWRRLVRLYPVHLTLLLFLGGWFLLAEAAGVAPHQAGRASGREFLLQLLMLNGWGASQGWSWNYPSWSVSTEWAGYLAFPLLLSLVSRLRARTAVQCALASWAALGVVAVLSPAGLNLTYAGALWRFFPEFLAGMAIAVMLPALGPREAVLAGVAGLAVVTLGILAGPPDSAIDAVAVGGIFLCLLALAAARKPVLGRVPGLTTLGGLSYCVYMSYAPVELAFARLWRHQGLDPSRHPWLWAAVMALAILALAWLLARFVERPAIRHLAGRAVDR